MYNRATIAVENCTANSRSAFNYTRTVHYAIKHIALKGGGESAGESARTGNIGAQRIPIVIIVYGDKKKKKKTQHDTTDTLASRGFPRTFYSLRFVKKVVSDFREKISEKHRVRSCKNVRTQYSELAWLPFRCKIQSVVQLIDRPIFRRTGRSDFFSIIPIITV